MTQGGDIAQLLAYCRVNRGSLAMCLCHHSCSAVLRILFSYAQSVFLKSPQFRHSILARVVELSAHCPIRCHILDNTCQPSLLKERPEFEMSSFICYLDSC